MANLKVWFIEEIRLGGGDIGHRQTVMEFDEDTGEWIRPDGRLADATARSQWDAVMTALGNIGGKDRSWIVNPVSLMDYCNNFTKSRSRRKRGTTDRSLPNE